MNSFTADKLYYIEHHMQILPYHSKIVGSEKKPGEAIYTGNRTHAWPLSSYHYYYYYI